MVIGIDNVEFDSKDTVVDLSEYTDLEEKYVIAVNNKVDMLITSDKETGDYFKSNGIATFIKS